MQTTATHEPGLTATETTVYRAMQGITVGLTRAIGGILVKRASHTFVHFVVSGTFVAVSPKEAAQLLCLSIDFNANRLGLPDVAGQARLERAFKLVQPASHWKDKIEATVSFKAMADVNVTIVDVVEAIEHFTCTLCRLSVAGVDNRGSLSHRVEAAGYRAGPAGDH